MRIPVFVSCPTVLNKNQKYSHRLILRELVRVGLEARALGRSDYPTNLPLREVYVLAKHCSGGVILGFEQFVATSGESKRGTPQRKTLTGSMPFPSPWNHLEAGVLFSLGLPLLVFKETAIEGGIFDAGVSDVFVHRMPTFRMTPDNREAFIAVVMKWQAEVRTHYYGNTGPVGREE
jgi:hypothetical protein